LARHFQKAPEKKDVQKKSIEDELSQRVKHKFDKFC